MNNSYNIIRRFTPPTCTLEIWGKNSSLSRWTKKAVVKNIQFKLSFDDPRNLDTEPLIIEGNRDKLEQLYNTVLSYTGNFLEKSFTTKPLAYSSINEENIADNQPHLVAQGLVNHQFKLGELTNSKNSSEISLSATQLFDLVSALEEYKTEMSALTQLSAKEKKSHNILPLGLSVAGILLAIGITTAGINIANQTEEEQITAQQDAESQVNNNSALEKVVPPTTPEIAEKPATIAQKNDPISSTEKLPPPPPVDSPKPQPNIPDPAKYPPIGNLTIPPISSVPIQTPNQTEASNIPAQQDNSQVESTIAVNPENTSSETIENSDSVTNSNESENINRNKIIIDSENSDSESTINQQPELNTSINEEAIISEENAIRQNIADSKKEIALNNTPKSSSEETAIDNQLEPKIPQDIQLQEVKSYFNQKWQSPEDLKQTLEYRLVINKDGSINRIIPIGKASEIYLDRTNIPLMGESFVSPLKDNDSAIIRLLLSPDGEVRTFLE